VLPARVARNGQLWIPGGRLNIRNERFRDDPEPVQEGCRCLLCRRFSRAYLAHLFRADELLAYRLATCHNHLFRADELLAYRLATCHNLTFTLDFMAGIRAALGTGNLPERLPKLRQHARRRSHDATAVQLA